MIDQILEEVITYDLEKVITYNKVPNKITYNLIKYKDRVEIFRILLEDDKIVKSWLLSTIKDKDGSFYQTLGHYVDAALCISEKVQTKAMDLLLLTKEERIVKDIIT